jgi:excinuclease ABC subunit C
MTNFPELNLSFNDLIKVSKVKQLKWIPHHIHNTVGGGIYRMYDIENNVVYVGKSVDVHRRLHEHYSKKSNTDYFIDEVVKHEVLIENNIVMQSLLEQIFIAYHQPKYNTEVQEEIKRGADNNVL